MTRKRVCLRSNLLSKRRRAERVKMTYAEMSDGDERSNLQNGRFVQGPERTRAVPVTQAP